MPLSAEARFAEVLAELPAVERSALALSEIGGLDTEEIAARLGTEPLIARKLLERARTAARMSLAGSRRGIAALVPVQGWWLGTASPAARAVGLVAAAVVGTSVASGGASASEPALALSRGATQPAAAVSSAPAVSAAQALQPVRTVVVRREVSRSRGSRPTPSVRRPGPGAHRAPAPTRAHPRATPSPAPTLPTSDAGPGAPRATPAKPETAGTARPAPAPRAPDPVTTTTAAAAETLPVAVPEAPVLPVAPPPVALPPVEPPPLPAPTPLPAPPPLPTLP